MSMCNDLLGCWKRVFAMTSAFSWQNSVSLCPASFCTPRPNLTVILGICWLPTFAFWSQWWKGHLSSFLVLILEDLIGLHRTGQLQLLWHQWLGHRLGITVMLIERVRGRLNEFGMNIFTLWYIKQVNNKHLLYSRGNYIQSVNNAAMKTGCLHGLQLCHGVVACITQ